MADLEISARNAKLGSDIRKLGPVLLATAAMEVGKRARLSDDEDAVDQCSDPGKLDGGDNGKDGDVVYPIANQRSRSPNLGLMACLLFCLACWAGLVYLIGLALG